MRRIAAFLIRCYQKTLSPDHGPFARLFPLGYCCYVPSCSMYARTAILRHGVIKGGYLACNRILRCNPRALPAIDEVPH